MNSSPIFLYSCADFIHTYPKLAREYVRVSATNLDELLQSSMSFYVVNSDISHSALQSSDTTKKVIVILPGTPAEITTTLLGTTHAIDFLVAPGARVTFLVEEPFSAMYRFFALAHSTIDIYFYIKKSARFSAYTYAVGEHARILVRGLYLLHKSETVHIETAQLHHVPSAITDVIFKGVLTDSAQAHYKGTIIIQKEGNKAHAYLYNKNMLLSSLARVFTMPQLEVVPHDVQCKHGSAVSFVDPYASMYLQSRGISEKRAQRILIESFVADCVYGNEQKFDSTDFIDCLL